MGTYSLNKSQWLFVFLSGLFITNAVTAELISNKLIEIPFQFDFFGGKLGPFVTIVGILPWPVVFLLTDLLNDRLFESTKARLNEALQLLEFTAKSRIVDQ